MAHICSLPLNYMVKCDRINSLNHCHCFLPNSQLCIYPGAILLRREHEWVIWVLGSLNQVLDKSNSKFYYLAPIQYRWVTDTLGIQIFQIGFHLFFQSYFEVIQFSWKKVKRLICILILDIFSLILQYNSIISKSRAQF